MTYYVCIDTGNPFKVEIDKYILRSGDCFYLGRYGGARLFEVMDVHKTETGTQLQVSELNAEPLRYPVAMVTS